MTVEFVPKSEQNISGQTGAFNGRRLGFARAAAADTPIR